MRIDDCNILITVYEEQNLSRAAEALFISQPSVTYRIQQMENAYDIKIFTKGNKGIRFTAEGEILVDYAKKILSEHKIVKNTLNNMGDELRGTLRIGVALNYAHFKLPVILKQFLQAYPKVKVNLQTALSPDVMELLENELIDIAIESGGYKWAGLKILLRTDKICLISKEKIEMEDLPQLPMIRSKANPNLKKLIDDWWKDHFKNPPIVMMEVDHVTTCKEMVKCGLGYGIVPSDCLATNEPFHITELTNNGLALQRETWLNYQEGPNMSSVVEEFVKYISAKKHM